MRRFDEPILVTRPFLPPLDDFRAGLEEIWKNRWLTNNGPVLKRFQAALAIYLNVPETNIALFNNGTLALELGYYAMGLSGGDVITTPFTFVATSHALKRIGAVPVFADVDPKTLCLDPRKVERLITKRTKAIVPVHVYGNLCEIGEFDRLSQEYGIPVIYDAAHAFGAEVTVHAASTGEKQMASVATCGDMSMFSMHPTKLFHSCEGGLLVFRNPDLRRKLEDLRNFAIHSEFECVDVGTNAKMNELQALMGIECLKRIDSILDWRRRIDAVYRNAFAGCDAITYLGESSNCAYCPVLFRDECTCRRVYDGLKKRCNVFARRYFYPLISEFEPYSYAKGSTPIAEEAASRILTLPTYHGLPLNDAAQIAECVKEIAG